MDNINIIPEIDFSGKVMFHIGPHKTGTTSIQSILSTNYHFLLDYGVLYPMSGRRSNSTLQPMHHPLILSLLDGQFEQFKNYVMDLSQEINKYNPRIVLISTEVLSRETIPDYIFLSLKHIFGNAQREWILYLRKQDDLLKSRYAEHVKRGLLKWPDTIHSLNKKEILDHEIRINNLKRIVKTDTITPLSFDSHKRNIVEHFLTFINIGDTSKLDMQEHKNVTLPWRTVEALRLANAFPGPLRRIARRVVLKVDREASKRQMRFLHSSGPLSEKECEKIRNYYSDSNQRVANKYFRDDELETIRGIDSKQ